LDFEAEHFRVFVVGGDLILVLVEFVVKFADLSCGESQVFLCGLHLAAQGRVFADKFLYFGFNDFVLLIVGGDPLFVVVEFVDDLLVLAGGQSQIFLRLPHVSVEAFVVVQQTGDLLLQGDDGFGHSFYFRHLPVEVADLDVLLLDYRIESLDLLGEQY
jgi:hypothetical protein